MRAIVMNATGGPEVLDYVERPDPVAGPGEALVEIAFAGVNFMDVGVRRGMAWTDVPNPKILGVEGVGRILEIGRDHAVLEFLHRAQQREVEPGDIDAANLVPGRTRAFGIAVGECPTQAPGVQVGVAENDKDAARHGGSPSGNCSLFRRWPPALTVVKNGGASHACTRARRTSASRPPRRRDR